MIRSAWVLLGFRSASDFLGCLRIFTLIVALMLFLTGFFLVSVKAGFAWIVLLRRSRGGGARRAPLARFQLARGACEPRS